MIVVVATLTAHPRSRGENTYRRTGSQLMPGSSPLTRGKLHHPDSILFMSRLIPAHAGKTTIPRKMVSNDSGSSPLTRGKLHQRPVRARPSRLIPAHAGKTLRQLIQGLHQRAHPRSRGENLIPLDVELESGGSSPLTRGKPGVALRAALPVPAHPRSRGENTAILNGSAAIDGSSPLTRGKHRRQGTPLGLSGLIPAHAGKTAPRYLLVICFPAHPRSRGENWRRIWHE